MPIFAEISSGTVVNRVVAAAVSDLASDKTWVDLTGISPAPDIGWDYSGGAFAPPPPPATPAPTLVEQAQAALSVGLTITSASTPALDGTYPLTDAMQANLVALEGYYQKFSAFPNGASTVSLKDTSGTVHSFTYTQFEALFQKLGDVRAALIDCVDGISTTLPPTSATIA